MKSKGHKFAPYLQSIFLYAVILLFFFQLLTEFVEGIYLYGLLGTDIPPEIGLVAIFLIPFLLLLPRKGLSSSQTKLLISLVLVARSIEIMLPTRGRMIFSGLGLAGVLLAFPALLAISRSQEKQSAFSRQVGLGFTTAILTHIVFRAFLSGSDISGYGMFRIITWGLAAVSMVILWKMAFTDDIIKQTDGQPNKLSVLAYAVGLFGVLATIYIAIEAPNVLARWAGVSPYPVFLITIACWGAAGWWWMSAERVPKSALWIISSIFLLAILMAILPYQVQFPPTADGGYPLLAPQVTAFQVLPLYAMLVLSPILFFLFMHYLDHIMANRPSLRLLGGSFGLGGIFLLIVVLSHVFTTVYDYIPVIGPFFRDKFWLVYLIAGLMAVLPALLKEKYEFIKSDVPVLVKRSWLGIAVVLLAAVLVGMPLLLATPPTVSAQSKTLRVFTYNIQQGYNDSGERNFDGQIALVKSTDPDIVGLQESDTARIAGGNADVVAYFANRLDMYAYYGPSPITGTFGIALLSKYPIQNPHTYFLYSQGEQVAVIQAEIEISGSIYTIYVTHLGNGGPLIQISQMLELMHGRENVVVMGDFNFRPYEEQFALATASYSDAYTNALESAAPAFWGEDQPFDIGERIDHVFVSPEIPVLYVEYFTQSESDHPGLFVELGIE